jgi:hypothetical protein
MPQLPLALKLEDSDRFLYLAIPDTAWNTFFRREFAKLAIAEYQLRLIIFDVSDEVIVQWYP